MKKIDILERIGLSVARSIKDEFPNGGGGKKMGMGADGYHTSLIDRIAEDLILDEIKKYGLDWDILSEERGKLNNRGTRTLIVDPIDGTYNAISSIPFFSTSLGLMDNSSKEITDALVINIPAGKVFRAHKGKGSYVSKQRIRTRDFSVENAVVSSYIGPEAKGWVDPLIFWPKRTRYFGCISLEICLVASGAIDLFVMFGRIPRLTDIAGASLILREAGGEVFLLDNDNRVKIFEPGFNREKTRSFFAVGDPTSLKRVLEISGIPFEMEGY